MNKVERLIKYFRPSHYELELHVDKNQKTITGKVLVTGEAVANTVKLHAKDMQIERVVCESREIKTFHEGDILTLHGISRGFTQFTIEFKLKLTGSMHGAYLSTYKLGGKTETIVTTQFESHYARECFPCVDEPEAKAVFELTITTPDTDDTVISNMPSHLEVDKHGSAPVLKATFEPTPRMSTYLLAFCVGAFQKLSGKTKHGVDVNVYATPAQAPDSLSFALDIATRSLDFYEDYFDVPYPLPKSDHVALPDFEAGAMENWGLVTYREACLLADPKLTPIEAQRSIATTIAHELAHMWFGDLVTMKWWDDLWLNESFATMIEYVAIDALEPSWQIWQDFETSCTVSSLRRDAMDGVQPVYQDVSHPDEIQSLFDPSIVYAKGARLMHMLVHMMGEAAFRRGLKKYFNKHEYGSAVGDDLWAALGSETNLDIRDFMKQWIDRPGYPVVSVRLEEGKITLEQHRFSLGKAPDMTWPIPLDANLDILPKVFDTRKLVVEDESIGPDTLVHVNQSRTGQFLVNYDTASLQNLLGSIDVADSGACLGLLTEQSLLAKAQLVDTLQIFKLLDKFAVSIDDSVWSMLSLALRDTAWFVDIDTPAEQALKNYRKKLASGQYTRLSWQAKPGEPDTDTRLRNIVAGMMVAGDDERVIEQAISDFDKAKSVENLSPNLRWLSLLAKVRCDESDKLVDELTERYHSTPSSDVRDDIGVALCVSRQLATIKKLLQTSLNKDIVRLQDTAHWVIGLMRNRRFTDIAWQYYRDNWDWFEREMGDDKRYADFPRYMASALCTEQQLAEFKEFFGPMANQPALKRNIEVGIREIEERVSLITSEAPKVREYLSKYLDS